MQNFLKRKKSNGTASTDDAPSRITNETVAEHREQVLAGGRKYKYPIQYQKHKLVINSIVIGVAAVVILTILGWQQLYIAQNSSKLMYRITQIIPARVASIDGEPVLFGDYLMRYRSSIFYLQKQESVDFNAIENQGRAAFIQRQELDNAEQNALAVKLSRTLHVSVTDDEVTNFIQKDIQKQSVSLNAYEKTVLESFYDWSLDEYRYIVKGELLKHKVSIAMDTDAKAKAVALRAKVVAGVDIAAIARESSDDDTTKASGGDSGVLPLDTQDTNGLITAAKKLEKGQLSDLIEGVDGYYFIKLINKDSTSVQFNVVKIALKAFDDQFAKLRKDGKIKEYITVKSTAQ